MIIVFGSPEAQAILARDREQYKLLQQAREIAEQEGDELEDALAEVARGEDLLVSQVASILKRFEICPPEEENDLCDELEAAEAALCAAEDKLALYRLALDIQKGKVHP